MTMTSAEMKCLRESMGLTTKWLAARWDVAEFSVKRWERDRYLPDNLETDLRGLKRRFDAEVRHTAAVIVPRTEPESTGDMPAAWRRAIAQRARELSGARILYIDDEQL